jgi:hypothetical protein
MAYDPNSPEAAGLAAPGKRYRGTDGKVRVL